MKRISLYFIFAFLFIPLSAYETQHGFREILYLWENGNKEEALQKIDSLPKDNELSTAIYIFSVSLFQKGETLYAKKFLEKALEINPDFEKGWDFLSFMELRKGNVHLFFKNLPRTCIAFFKNFKNQVIFAYFLLKSLWIAILISFFLGAVFLLIKYIPLIIADLSRIFGGLSDKSGGTIGYLLIFLLPSLLYLGWGLASIIWIAFVWSYLQNKERRIVLLAFLVFIAGVIGNNIAGIIFPEIVSSDILSKKGKGLSLLFSADENLRNGYFNEAIKTLEEINKEKPNLYSLITLGNIRLKEGKYEESRKLYEKALMLYPNSSVPYVNLSILFSILGENSYAEKYKTKAVALKGEVRELIWPNLNSAFAWKWLVREYLKSVNILSTDIFLLLVVCFIAISINLILRNSPILYGKSRFCLSCRKSINIYFDMKITNPDYCEDCYRLFVWKPPELELVRASKSREIKANLWKEMLYYRGISLLLPYSGLFRYDYPLPAFGGLAIFALLISMLFFAKKMGYFAWTLTFLLLAIVVYIISIIIFEIKVTRQWKEL